MTAATTAPSLTIPTPPFALGDVVYDREHNPQQPMVVTGIEYKWSDPMWGRGVWFWHVSMVPVSHPEGPAYSPFDVDDLAREPWGMEGGE